MDIIKELKERIDYPLNSLEMLDKLDYKTNFITYKDLKKKDSIDDLLYPHNSCIILYLNTKNFGHYNCIFKYPNKNIVEVFDSYGKIVDNPLKYSEYSKKMVKGQKLLSKLLYKSKYEVEYNDFPLQGKKSSTCGRWVIHRLLNKKQNINEYINFWRKYKYRDFLISYLIV